MGNKLYLKVVPGDWRNSSRDRRELKAVQELGYNTLVIASTKESAKKINDKVEGFDVIRVSTRPFGNSRFAAKIGHLYGFMSMINAVSKIDCEIISGHNYLGVLIGYYGSLFKKKKPKIIYDSHEFELYQSVKKGKVKRFFVKQIEAFVLNICDINMMVTDSIADDVQKIYKLKKRPLVVRNIPPRIELNNQEVLKNREEILHHLNIHQNGFVMMYHGGIAKDRGIEQALQAVSKLDDVGLVILGYALQRNYLESLKEKAVTLNISDRVYFKDALPFNQLLDFIAATDLGIVLIQNTCTSFFYSLPNKLFENIQSETPVIGSAFPEIGRIITEYNVGISIQPDNIETFVDAVNRLRYDNEFYKNLKNNCKVAREQLCWQVEKEVLKEAINQLYI